MLPTIGASIGGQIISGVGVEGNSGLGGSTISLLSKGIIGTSAGLEYTKFSG